MCDQKEPLGSSKNTGRKGNSRMPGGVTALVTRISSRKCRRFVFWRVPDAVFILILVGLWRFYIRTANIVPSTYSVVLVSMATIGIIMSYITGRYHQTVFQKLPLLWKCHWVLMLIALPVVLLVQMFSRSQVVKLQAVNAIYIIPISLLTAASIVAVVSMLRAQTKVLSLFGFLLAQALLIFVFTQPYIYCNFIDTKWNLSVLEHEATAVVSDGPQSTIRALLSSNPGQVYSVVALLRENRMAIPKYLYDMPELDVLISGVCERVNFGAALYLSIITWTSVGFGDLIPTYATRGYAAVESILGYLFMAALAAVLIRWMRKPSRNYEEGDNDERT